MLVEIDNKSGSYVTSYKNNGKYFHLGRVVLLQVLLLLPGEVHEVHQSERLHHDGCLRKELLLVR